MPAKTFSRATQIWLLNLKFRYRRSLFGVIWILFPAIVLCGSAEIILKQNDTGRLGIAENHVVIVVVSVILWQTFLDFVLMPMTNIRQETGRLKAIAFPSDVWLCSVFIDAILSSLLRFAFVSSWLFIHGFSVFGTGLFGTFLALIILAALGAVLSLWLAPVSLVFDDIVKASRFVGWLLIPTLPIYSAEMPPPWLAVIIDYNPLGWLLLQARNGMLNHETPSFFVLLLILPFAAVLVYFSYRYFERKLTSLVHLLGN